jgi:hypothetical protein
MTRLKEPENDVANTEFLSDDLRPSDLIMILEGFDVKYCTLSLDRGIRAYLVRLIKERAKFAQPIPGFRRPRRRSWRTVRELRP